MKGNESRLKLFTLLHYIVAGLAVLYSIFNFPIEKADIKLPFIVFITIFWGATTQIQLPRTKMHLSIAESFIFFVLLTYGMETAVLLAGLESIYASSMLRRRNIKIKVQTIFLNGSITAISTFFAGTVLGIVYSYTNFETQINTISVLAATLSILSLSHFAINSVLIAFLTSLKSQEGFIQVWNKNCFNTLIMYLVGAIVAGLMMKATANIDPFLILISFAFVSIAYMTYRRYVDDVKATSEKAEKAERKRAEQAETHVLELQHYISELESSTTALRESEKRLRYTAFYDTLTDLPNRNKYLEKLQFLIEKSKFNPDLKFAVLHLNLNRFKTINDSLGYATGNLLLQNVAKRLMKLIYKDNLIARFGGDEFAVILTDVANLEEVIHFAELLSAKVSEPYTLEGRQVFTSASIGIAVNRQQQYDAAENLLRDANIAMYHAKQSEIAYTVFDQNMHVQAVTRLQLETDLRYAIERNELRVFYQPILDLNTIKLMGFEALMRWQHPQRGLIPPNEFIPVSELTGLIVPMSLWILRESCEKLVEWKNKYPTHENLIISVNISGKHFAHPDLVEQIQKIIKETGIEVKNLKLEITESAVMENAETAIRMLKQLRRLGINLSIDDFGTGYSSLSYLHRFPINTLKVDRSFVRTMEAGSENGEIVHTIIALAKSLKLSVIAEGIESIHQLHQLRVLGCEYGQGYLFSRPVPVEEAERLLTDSNSWQSILPQHRSGIVSHAKNEFPLLEIDEIVSEPHEIIQ